MSVSLVGARPNRFQGLELIFQRSWCVLRKLQAASPSIDDYGAFTLRLPFIYRFLSRKEGPTLIVQGTSLIRNRLPLGPYSRSRPRALRKS
jgi:hypothetical protein